MSRPSPCWPTRPGGASRASTASTPALRRAGTPRGRAPGRCRRPPPSWRSARPPPRPSPAAGLRANIVPERFLAEGRPRGARGRSCGAPGPWSPARPRSRPELVNGLRERWAREVNEVAALRGGPGEPARPRGSWPPRRSPPTTSPSPRPRRCGPSPASWARPSGERMAAERPPRRLDRPGHERDGARRRPRGRRRSRAPRHRRPARRPAGDAAA